jgi:phosphoglycerate dehydrogenase-like enzyme
MNILSVVDLPGALWEMLVQEHPGLVCRTELDAACLDSLREWPEIVFGNVPVEWVMEAARKGKMRWLQSVSAGVEAYAPLSNTGVQLTSGRGLHHRPLAQHLLLMMLALTRNLPAQLRNQQAQVWHRDSDAIFTLAGKTVGVLGYGGIGRALASLVQPLEMHVVGVTHSCQQPRLEDGVKVWPMERADELIGLSDHLVLCLPLTSSTRGFMNEARFASMCPGACFYNIARGQLVEESALLRRLQSGHLAGAALDVFQQEPLPKGHPFWTLPNVIVTPHIAGHFRGLREQSFELFRDNLSRYLRGEPLMNEVNLAGDVTTNCPG